MSMEPTARGETDEGYLVPAEWAPHEATWLSWPHAGGNSWPGEACQRVWPVIIALTKALAAGEKVFINVTGRTDREYLRRELGSLVGDSVILWDIPTNDAWCRDHGAVFVRHRGSGLRAAVAWDFNAWGQKYHPFSDDAAVSRRMGMALGDEVMTPGMVLEGGSLDGNGEGILMVSERSVIDERRNPGISRDEAAATIRRYLGVTEVLWVDAELEGDDTDGHVDNFARFVAPDTVVVAVCEDKAHPNHVSLALVEARIRERGFGVIELPMPAQPVVVHGLETPATYANFYIANGRVIVPLFGDANDARAAAIIGEALPGREVVVIPARELIWGQGGFHCITQQVPRGES